MKHVILISLLLWSSSLIAKVEIDAFKKYSWDNAWNESIMKELDEEGNAHMLSEAIDLDDLKKLGCPGFNSVSDLSLKKDFWVVFFSALTRSESAFNPKARAVAPKGGHGNYGLLQFSKQTARLQCGLATDEELMDPAEHLRCGVKLMAWQLKGAPSARGKLLRPDLKSQLFGKYILLWGPLRQNDRRGRALLVGWFKRHLTQLPFCEG